MNSLDRLMNNPSKLNHELRDIMEGLPGLYDKLNELAKETGNAENPATMAGLKAAQFLEQTSAGLNELATDIYRATLGDTKALDRITTQGALIALTEGVARYSKGLETLKVEVRAAKAIEITETNFTRVGQWMSKNEFEEFGKTGIIPRSNVLTKGKEGWMRQAEKGDYYVEFDVNSSLLFTKNEELGWALVKSKNTMFNKLASQKNQPLPLPLGQNIKHIFTKTQ